MSISISDLRKRVAAQFSDLELVNDSVIRYTRKMHGSSFAVYYLDVAQYLPETTEQLTDYQDRVIGRHYFEGEKSLQWSNYLYFIADRKLLEKSDARKAKDLIERDRSYARKFVIAEEELDSVLNPSVVEPTEIVPQTNILSLWVERLIEAGLDAAIISNADLPSRLEVIELSSPQSAGRRKVSNESMAVNPAPFLRSLHLKTFREFPLRRVFEFGTVNLIVGANGSGKTSVLEAIELFYCGRNKRNPTPPPAYELIATFANGTHEKATASRDLQLFRDRNLKWYGQSEIKTSYLYQSFAQFNFLDTDAAVHLAESPSGRIEEDLSKLLVGPDASKIWRDMERVSEALEARLRDLRSRDAQFGDELLSLENRLKDISGIQQESDLIRVRLDEMIRRIGWTSSQGAKEDFAARLVQALSELVSLSRQATELEWTEKPVSIDGLTRYSRSAKEKAEVGERQVARLEVVGKDLKRLADESEHLQLVNELAKQAKRLVEAGVPGRAADHAKQQSVVATYSGWLAGFEAEALEAFSSADLNLTVEAYQKTAAVRRSAAHKQLDAKKAEYKTFSNLRDQSANLAQELRQIAARILENSSKPDECPLCHTEFRPGELAKHMTLGLDEHLEKIGQAILDQVTSQETAVRNANADAAKIDRLAEFSRRAKLPVGDLVRSTASRVREARRSLAEARERMEALNGEIAALESQGLSPAKFEQVSIRLKEEGYPLSEISSNAVDQLILALAEKSKQTARMIEEGKLEEAETKDALTVVLGTQEPVLKEFRTALARLKERVATTESVLAKLRTFESSFAWPGSKSLAELAVEAESVRKVAVELQTALGKEKLAHTTLAESTKRRDSLQDEQERLSRRINRLTQAHAVLADLQKEHSLDKAMASALQQNRSAIESIFTRIHAPAEFRGLGSVWTTLVRRNGDREAKLTEISTGQRAAFALSIFLAQNAQLRVAPPVVLIDDPIAHVDDLNSLSFLDYLRELALTSRRQIYFATANEKLATLFERKFDFLGLDEFKRIDLRRTA